MLDVHLDGKDSHQHVNNYCLHFNNLPQEDYHGETIYDSLLPDNGNRLPLEQKLEFHFQHLFLELILPSRASCLKVFYPLDLAQEWCSMQKMEQQVQ